MEKAYLIVNPASAGGKTKRHLNVILENYNRIFGCDNPYFITGKPKDAEEQSYKAVNSGYELIICAGGDGTVHETVNGFFKHGQIINPNLKLGVINSGTGHGFAQSLGLPKTFEEQFEVIKAGFTIEVDLGRAIFEQDEKYFVNELQLGIGGAVVRNVNRKSKEIGGKFAFGLGTLKKVFTHPNQRLKLLIDNDFEINEIILGVVIANGEFTGGGMRLTPNASLFDGELNVLIMAEQNLHQRLGSFTKIYSGRHIETKYFKYLNAKKIGIYSSENILAEADGEIFNKIPLSVEVIPSAIKVLTKKNR